MTSPEFHSQCGEDRWLFARGILPKAGFFVEVGAFDGIMSSNTLWLEQLGWGGFLVEPDAVLAARCQENRRVPVLLAAAGKERGVATFYINRADRGLSGLTRKGDPVPTLVERLDTVLNSLGVSQVDFLSIDTEGTELDVWKGIGSIRPFVVMLEHQTCNEPSNRDAILERLQADGYELLLETQYNLIFRRLPNCE